MKRPAAGATVKQQRPPWFLPRAIWRIAEDRMRTWFFGNGSRLIHPWRRLTQAVGLTETFLHLAMLEHRLGGSTALVPVIRSQLMQIHERMARLIGPAPQPEMLKNSVFRAIVLSMPRQHEGRLQKGVLLIKFTETFRFFFHLVDVPALLGFFRIVLEPSWSGYCLPEILFWTRFEDQILVMASEQLDRDFLIGLQSNLMPTSVGAGDWVDYRVFRPLGVERTNDVVYVANLTPIKRVHVLLSALRRAAKKGVTLRAVLVLSSWGSDKAVFEQLVDFYGVRSQITVLMNLDHAAINEWLGRSRVSVLLSKKEGSNKTLFESMFADTPVLLLRDNVGVNKDYINEHTGRLVSEDELSDALISFSQGEYRNFSPRQWAIANIAPEISTMKLEDALRELDPDGVALPLLVKVNSPEATYMNPADAVSVPPLREILGCFLNAAGQSGREKFREFVK